MKKITLIDTYVFPRTAARNDYQFTFSIVDSKFIGKPDEESKTEKYNIKVGISSQMQALWKIRQENIDIEKACYEYGKNEIVDKYKNQIILNTQELEILTTTHSKECPFITDKINYRIGASEDFEVK